MMALVFGPTFSRTSAGSIVAVTGSTSAKMGRAPHIETEEAVAKNVNAGTITSSPGPTPAARSAAWRAAVPLLTATAWGTPQ